MHEMNEDQATSEEIRFWERVYVGCITRKQNSYEASHVAAEALKRRRQAFPATSTQKGPYQ